MFCRHIRVALRGKPPACYEYGATVEYGSRYMDGVVVYANPPKCIVTPQTKIEFVEYHDIRVKQLVHNILVEIDGGGEDRTLVYPKQVWETIMTHYVEPLRKSMPPRNPGFLLYGPPGTGKTSMIRLMCDMLGLHVVQFRPHIVLSKYVGEAEKNTARLFERAVENQPSILVIDDAEWVARARSLVGGYTEDSITMVNVLNIVFDKVEEIKRKKHLVVVATATNMEPRNIDPALLRHGRLGKPVYVPLPDLEAVETILKVYKVYEPSLARKLVNLGLPMSDIVNIAKTYRETNKLEIEPWRGRGYSRVAPPDIGEDVQRTLRESLSKLLPESLFRVGVASRIHLSGPVSIGEPLIIAYLSMVLGRPCVLLSDERYFDEAMVTASTGRAVLVVDTEMCREDTLRLIYKNCSEPVVFLGKSIPFTVFRVDSSLLVARLGREATVKLLLKYYGIEYDEDSVRRIVSGHYDRFIEYVAPYMRDLRVKNIKELVSLTGLEWG